MKRYFQKHQLVWGSLAITDLLAVFASFLLAYWIRIQSGFIPYNAEAIFKDYMELYWFSIPVLMLIFRSCHLYDRHEIFSGTGEYVQVAKACTFYALGIIVISYSFHNIPSRGWLLGTWVLAMIMLCTGRFAFRCLIKRVWGRGNHLERALIIGANEEARELACRLEQTNVVDVVGFLDEFSHIGATVWKDKAILGPPYKLKKICQKENVNLVILVQDAASWETQREILRRGAALKNVDIQISPGFCELYLASMHVSYKGNVPLLRFQPGYVTGLDAGTKKIMDYVLGALLIIGTGPVFLIISSILWLQGTRPIIDGYHVAGRNNRTFRMHKYRTGTNSATNYSSFKSKIKHKTGSGKMKAMNRFLLRTGLDKLPQLFNVMLGQMSIVGPRVVPENATEKYGPWLAGILAVKPGMTGSWALKQAATIEEEISLSSYDVSNWTIWKDLSILGQTLMKMIRSPFTTRIVEPDEESFGMEVLCRKKENISYHVIAPAYKIGDISFPGSNDIDSKIEAIG